MSVRRSSRIASIATPSAPDVAKGPKRRTSGSQGQGTKAKRQKAHGAREQTVDKGENQIVNGVPQAESEFKVPVTPIKRANARRATVTRPKHPPLTPTPSLINVIRAPYSSGDIDDATPPPDRPVEPHITNAPLVTPGGTQHVAYEDTLPESTPSKTGLPRPIATTNTLLDQACAHLIRVEPRLKPLIEKHPCHIFSAEGFAEMIDPFRSLSSGIMGQQVSGAAAKSIKNKFIALFNEEGPEEVQFPTPAQVAVTEIARLRLAGLSQRKAEYIQGLAQKFASGELTNEMLMRASDEEVMEKLIAVRGLGKWSVEMFACFALKRLDIISTGDLGVQRGMAAFFGKDVKKLKAKGGGKWKYMSEQDMLEKSAPFAPYRSLFMWYMWRVEDVDVEVMQA
ncbi:DNA-3-methyladenine glycosylase II [Cladophialophora psammophila CBS 110553]|uniref:DNA-3-methyladenine glycosylase II n=1 Tax=Cladophialophora psammophila CBS 110553 TaxID=1182543 RepID=W9X2T5_9EURO|nr:DNA-3-methyladenine glycosylase II [Cladophialophora psammophila CBS 110553]EXJ71625.1 DNA-3-methyladenine glycosylase II [Cladophialophora psammophila CBS 110553]